jgi:Holliday junction DNA helicase RuvA
MSGIDADEFVRCVHDANTAALVRLPGVGKKTAERLVIEMRDRLKDWSSDGPLFKAQPAAQGGRANIAEAEAALVALGYKPQEASKAISAVKADDASSEDLIRAALKNMNK